MSLATVTLMLVCAACGSTSATSSSGNRLTCDDFFAYGSWVQSVKSQVPQSTWLHHQKVLARRLAVDGPSARSRVLSSEARLAVKSIGPKEGENPANQMNASDVTCANLEYPPPGASVTQG
jgi:hypothetical protein